MTIIEHKHAHQLEIFINEVYGYEHKGIMNIVNADYLQKHPLDAALIIFAPLYKSVQSNVEIEEFICEYRVVFEYPDENMKDYEKVVTEYINKLKFLIDKYC